MRYLVTMLRKSSHIERPNEEAILCQGDLTRTAKGAGVNFVGKIIGGLLHFTYLVIAARMLGDEAFGIFMLALTVAAVTGALGRAGLEMAVIKFVSKFFESADEEAAAVAIRKSLKIAAGASMVLAVALFFLSYPLATKVFDKQMLSDVLRILAISLPFNAVMIISLAATQGFQVMKYSVYGQNLIQPFLNTILLVLLVFGGFGLRGAAFAQVISIVITCMISCYFLVSMFPRAVRFSEGESHVPGLLKYSFALAPVVLFNLMLMWTDTLVLGYYKSSAEVGIYNSAMRTAMINTLIVSSFSAIFAPMASDLHGRAEMGRLDALFKVVTKWTYSLSFALFLLIILLPAEIMSIFGEGFESGANALVVLAIAQIVNTGTGVSGVILVMAEKERLMFYNALGAFLLNACLNYILIPPFGIAGAACATAGTIIAVNIIMLAQVVWLLKIHPYSKGFFKITICGISAYGATLMIMTLWPLSVKGIYSLIIYAPVFLAIYAVSIVFSGLDSEDRLILDAVKQRLSRASGIEEPQS